MEKCENPFGEVGYVLTGEGGGVRTVADVETGEVMVLVDSCKGVFKRDSEVFIKVFRSDRLRDLNGVGLKVFIYLIFVVRPNVDWVELNVGDAMDWCRMKYRNDVYRGVRDLIRVGILAKRGGGSYWINPKVLFNGNRLKNM